MAGYVMNLDSEDSLKECIRTGVYSTRFSDKVNNYWRTPAEGTFADYYSMSAGDNIFFFIKRKIYGIGILVDVCGDCKYLNYHGAEKPKKYDDNDYDALDPLMENGNVYNRCICLFEPAPHFFMRSVDMDEALASNPSHFRMLRAMWKRSFIKLDDEETKALMDIILKRNEENIISGESVFQYDDSAHKRIEDKITDLNRVNANRLLAFCSEGPSVKHEMAIEAHLCSVLGRKNSTPFGKWDYVSHQVVASPFKPIDYMDKMDIFGYRYIPGFSTISKYIVVEIKAGKANVDVIDQTMKYVDWINQEYAHGDYSMIEAYIVAFEFPEEVKQKRDRECIRNFVKGYRPSEACTWDSVKLIRYEYYDDGIDYIEV